MTYLKPTPRQQEARAYRAAGLTYRQIAERMQISTQRVGQLLGGHNNSALVTKYLAKHRDSVVQLLGGKCRLCATTEPLEIDHIVPVGRHRESSSVMYGRVLQGDSSNLQLLCNPHHWNKTKQDRCRQRIQQAQAQLQALEAEARDIGA